MITCFSLQVKCDQYWPSRGTETYGLIQVTLLDTVELATYCVRTFALHKVYILIYTYYMLSNWKTGSFFPRLPFLLSFLSLTSLLSPCPPPSFCFLPYLCASFPYFLIPFLPFSSFLALPLLPSSSAEYWDFYRVHVPDNMKFCKLRQSSHHEKAEYLWCTSVQYI